MKKYIIALLCLIAPVATHAAETTKSCNASDKSCLMSELESAAPNIENKSWRDKVYRELAKSYASEHMSDKAIALINKIDNPDTKAMTIRGIGIASADANWSDASAYKALFDKLKIEAKKITHPPSNAIAYTYIAMAQAFAKDDEGAMETALTMTNPALKHKALAESAEIQAERGDFKVAMESIAAIDSVAFKNKAYATIAHIFTKSGQLDYAYKATAKIENAYKKAEALQKIINYDNEEENLKTRSVN